MTKKQQVKQDAPKAVELNQAALDRAAGGAGAPMDSLSLNYRKIEFLTPGTSVLKTT